MADTILADARLRASAGSLLPFSQDAGSLADVRCGKIRRKWKGSPTDGATPC